MSAKCRICELGEKKVHQIETDYVNGLSVAAISKKFNVGYFSIRYHAEHHISNKLVAGATQKYNENGIDLMSRVDKLLERVELIFQRNYDKNKDHLALKALSEERNTIELLAKVSMAMHQNKMEEVEATRNEILNQDLPLHKLTKKERDLYFQLNMKLLGSKEDDISLVSFVEPFEDNRNEYGEEVEGQNGEVGKVGEGNESNKHHQIISKSKKRIRKRRPDSELTFKPIDKGTPPKRNGRGSFAKKLIK